MDLTQVLEITSCTHTGMVRSHNEDSIATDPQISAWPCSPTAWAATMRAKWRAASRRPDCKRDAPDSRPRARDRRDRESRRGAPAHASSRQGQHLDLPVGQQPAAVRGHGNHAGGDAVVQQPDNGCATSAIPAVTAFAATSCSRSPATIRCCRNRSTAACSPEAGQALAEQESGNEGAGHRAGGRTEVRPIRPQTGDIYLLCSDGLNDMVDDEDIEMTLAARQQPAARCRSTGADGE